MVVIGARFTGYAGRYVYHCHILEHEDMDMMRPFVVLPKDLLALMPEMEMDSPMPMG
jgi:spore coat protein A